MTSAIHSAQQHEDANSAPISPRGNGNSHQAIMPVHGSHSAAPSPTPPNSQHAGTLLIYLSGSIRKGNEDSRADDSFWSEQEERQIVSGVSAKQVQTLNPAKSNISRADYYLNFGCDLHLVNVSDAVLVDARTKRGIGIGAEMMFARFAGVPVITICPPNSAYRRDYLPDVFGEDLHDWIHPFVYGLSDYIVDDLDAAISLINDLLPIERRPQSDVHEAITYYNRTKEAHERRAAESRANEE
jgi:hypothetical protein